MKLHTILLGRLDDDDDTVENMGRLMDATMGSLIHVRALRQQHAARIELLEAELRAAARGRRAR